MRLSVAVGIATAGRSEILREMLTFVHQQSRIPDQIVVCAPRTSERRDLALGDAVRVILADQGLTVQRNAIIAAVPNADVIVFFDDDFFPDARYIEAVEAAYLADPNVVMTTGTVILDGIIGPGLTPNDASRTLGQVTEESRSAGSFVVYNAYGCNMSVALQVARTHGITFDTQLPLYAWQEDVDFSRRMASHGSIRKLKAAIGVHLGIKSGRQSGIRLGYSQVANPVYLLMKGTCNFGHVGPQIARNVVSNIVRTLKPEPYIDRVGRLRGNWLALKDVFRGHVDPNRILKL